MPDVVRFRVGDGPVSVVPEIDGVSLVEAVTAFEDREGHSPAGGYGGLVLASLRLGDLAYYYRGEEDRQCPGPGRAWLLGCECGDAGCWPLEAQVDLVPGLVVWTDFRQPHRPDRSYVGFGPFVFDRDQYDRAVLSALGELGG